MAEPAPALAIAAPAPKKTKKPPTAFQTKHALDFGLVASEQRNGKVVSVRCKFCQAFGREEKACVPQDGDEQAGKKQRGARTTVKIWSSFSPGSYREHHEGQHEKRWAAYQQLSDADKSGYFKTLKLGEQMVSHFDTDAAAVVFYIRKDIVDTVVGKLLLADAADDENGYRARSMAWFVADWPADDALPYSPITHYRVVLKAARQYKLVLRFVATGSTFRQTARQLQAVREVCSTSALGSCSEADVSKYVRVVAACNLEILGSILDDTWAFALAFDMANHLSKGYLALRLRFERGGRLHDVHAMLIPVVGAHTGLNMYLHIVKVLDALCPAWRYKLIGGSSDGTSNNTGQYSGALTRLLKDAAEVEADDERPNAVYRTWCCLHQLDIVVGKMYEVLGKGIEGTTPWLTAVTAMQGHLRRQQTLASDMGSICPPVQLTRWLAMEKLLYWLIKHRPRLMQHYTSYAIQHAGQGGAHASQPNTTVWLYTYAMQAVVEMVASVVARLQGKTVTIADAENSVTRLADSVAVLVGMKPTDHVYDDADEEADVEEADVVVTTEGGRFKVRTTEIEEWLREMGAFVGGALDELDDDVKGPALRSLGTTVLVLVEGLYDVTTMRDESNDGILGDPDPCTPQELCRMRGQTFAALIGKHKTRMIGGEDLDWELVDAQWSHLRKLYSQDTQKKTDLVKAMDALVAKEVYDFSHSWDTLGLGTSYPLLMKFAGGIACPYAHTATVESDFSKVRREKDDWRSNLQNFALEGCLQCCEHVVLQKIKTL